MFTTTEYSEKEWKLITILGYQQIAKNVSPIQLYRLLSEKAFIDKMDNKISDSIRNCMIACNEGRIYRMTPEWDELIII